MGDYIDRQAAIDAIEEYADRLQMVDWKENPGVPYKAYALNWCINTIRDLPSVEAEPVKHRRWIPVSERLPEEDTEVLISYRYKEGEGDTSHVDIDITTYGQMYFGGNKVGNNKHWRAPFEYFYSNYEVIAWMPLPEPYTEEGEAHEVN